MEAYINKRLINAKFTSEELYDKYPVLNLEFEDYIKFHISIGREGLYKLKNLLKDVEMQDDSSYFYFEKDKCEFFNVCKQKCIKNKKENNITIKYHCFNIKSYKNAFCPIREKILKELE